MSLLESGNVKRTSVGVGGAIAVAREAFEAYDRQVAAIVVQSQYLIQDCARLYEENAKLRELARRAHGCKTDDGCCEDCWGDYGECPIEADMKELRIEAEE